MLITTLFSYISDCISIREAPSTVISDIQVNFYAPHTTLSA